MDCHGWSWSFTHHTAADVLVELSTFYGHHGQRIIGAQPVGFVIATGVVTGSRVTVGEGHGAENLQTLACPKHLEREQK